MSQTKVELLYAGDCPNVGVARSQLLRAFLAAGLQPHWLEYRIDDPSCPPRLRGHGSPTVLVNGRDVFIYGREADADCCRVYTSAQGALAVAPPATLITAALKEQGRFANWRISAVGIPALAVALLPKLVCPACWPAYAAAASALGLTFLLDAAYLLPIAAAALLAAVAGLAFGARQRRGYAPAALALASAGLLLLAKFSLDSAVLLWTGAAAFTAAFIWNAWPRRNSQGQAYCPACDEPSASTANKGDPHDPEAQD
jgi:mercuric ion transport protein